MRVSSESRKEGYSDIAQLDRYRTSQHKLHVPLQQSTVYAMARLAEKIDPKMMNPSGGSASQGSRARTSAFSTSPSNLVPIRCISLLPLESLLVPFSLTNSTCLRSHDTRQEIPSLIPLEDKQTLTAVISTSSRRLPCSTPLCS
jgi:hypothetical protein